MGEGLLYENKRLCGAIYRMVYLKPAKKLREIIFWHGICSYLLRKANKEKEFNHWVLHL